jgi:hypothetical protein
MTIMNKEINYKVLIHLATKAANTLLFGLKRGHYCSDQDAKEIADDCGNELVRRMTMILKDRGYTVHD